MPAAAPTTTALDTERLTATTLEDLNASAGLLTRIDRKYLVASDTAQGVIDALAERASSSTSTVGAASPMPRPTSTPPNSAPTSRPLTSAVAASRSAPAPTWIRD